MKDNIIGKTISYYLAKKYGTNLQALKPPLGLNPFKQNSATKKRIYRIKRKIWQFDCFLFKKIRG